MIHRGLIMEDEEEEDIHECDGPFLLPIILGRDCGVKLLEDLCLLAKLINSGGDVVDAGQRERETEASPSTTALSGSPVSVRSSPNSNSSMLKLLTQYSTTILADKDN